MAQTYVAWSVEVLLRSAREARWWARLIDGKNPDVPGAPDRTLDDEFDDAPCDVALSRETVVLYSEGETGSTNGTAALLQRFLRACRPRGMIGFTWATWCSKSRPGEFDGGWVLVSATAVKGCAASTSLALAAAKAAAKKSR